MRDKRNTLLWHTVREVLVLEFTEALVGAGVTVEGLMEKGMPEGIAKNFLSGGRHFTLNNLVDVLLAFNFIPQVKLGSYDYAEHFCYLISPAGNLYTASSHKVEDGES